MCVDDATPCTVRGEIDRYKSRGKELLCQHDAAQHSSRLAAVARCVGRTPKE